MRGRRILLSLVAPVSALAFAVVVSSAVLLLINKSPIHALNAMVDYAKQTDSLIEIVNRAVPIYLAGLAVAIGFKMNLFNIGVEGQYRLAALIAAAAGAAVSLPPPLHVLLIVLVAMVVGSMWAAIPGVLKVTRGVHEVISTIMLNFISIGIGQYLLIHYFQHLDRVGDLIIKTKAIPKSGRFPSLNDFLEAFGVKANSSLYGFVLVALVVGILFYLLVWRTRFGYDLRASGTNPDAARVSGIDPNAMIVRTMLISGAIAGLVGLADMLGALNRYTLDFPVGYGFTGIAVALVGRNNPVGIALAALLFGFMDKSRQILFFNDIPKEVIVIMQGVIILSVVIAYEVVRRIIQAQELRQTAEQTKRVAAQEELDEVPA